MRILFSTIPERGHINPLLGVAQHLEAAGHEVAFWAEGDLSGLLVGAGLRARSYAGAADRRAGEVTSGREFVERIADKAWLRGWIRRLLVEAVPGQLPALRRAAADFRPDVLASDPMLYGPVLVAAERGLPWAGLSSSLNPVTPPSWSCELTETVSLLADARAMLFSERGVPVPTFRICDALSPFLNAVFTIEAYAPRTVATDEPIFYVGPSRRRDGWPRGDEADFPWERLREGRPLVYMSLGSQLYHQPRLFGMAVEALLREEVQLVLAVGDLVDGPFCRGLPDSVVAVRWAPQLQLLLRAALLISHGGANSIGEALLAGVPLLLLPQCNDQPLGARFLAESGAGRVLSPQEVSVAALFASCRDLLQESAPERARARMLGAALSARDGAARAAALLLELAKRRAPLSPLEETWTAT